MSGGRKRRVWLLLAAALALPEAALAQSPIPFVPPPQRPATRPVEARPAELPQVTSRPPGQVAAGDPDADAAYGAYQAGHFATAFRLATERIAADAQDAAAMTLLGELILQGLATRQDDRRAAEWYRLAADRGDMNAQFALGMLHLDGRGVERDEARARALLQQAADKGHGAASLNLALPLLLTGQPDDLQKAVVLLKRAADAEIGDAQHALAVLMIEGRGLPRDIEAGADMMARAASNGSLAGEVEFAILQFAGRGIGRDERAAARGFARAAARGNAIAQNRLARILFQGRWLPQDKAAAGGWHLAARAQGLADAELDADLERLQPEERAKAQAFAEDLVSANALTKAAAAAQSTATQFRK
jgi:TPR repeat protein